MGRGKIRILAPDVEMDLQRVHVAPHHPRRAGLHQARHRDPVNLAGRRIRGFIPLTTIVLIIDAVARCSSSLIVGVVADEVLEDVKNDISSAAAAAVGEFEHNGMIDKMKQVMLLVFTT